MPWNQVTKMEIRKQFMEKVTEDVNGHTNCTTVRPQTRYHPAQAKRAHAREVARSANKRTRAYTHT